MNDEDKSHFDKTTSGSPDAEEFLRSGEALASEGKWQEAAEAFTQSCRLGGGSESLANLGVAFWESGKQQEAFDKFAEAVQNDNSNGDAVANLYDAGITLQRESEVLNILENAAREGSAPEVFLYLARCRLAMGDDEGACSVLDNGLTAFPGDAGLESERASLPDAQPTVNPMKETSSIPDKLALLGELASPGKPLTREKAIAMLLLSEFGGSA